MPCWQTLGSLAAQAPSTLAAGWPRQDVARACRDPEGLRRDGAGLRVGCMLRARSFAFREGVPRVGERAAVRPHQRHLATMQTEILLSEAKCQGVVFILHACFTCTCHRLMARLRLKICRLYVLLMPHPARDERIFECKTYAEALLCRCAWRAQAFSPGCIHCMTPCEALAWRTSLKSSGECTARMKAPPPCCRATTALSSAASYRPASAESS